MRRSLVLAVSAAVVTSGVTLAAAGCASSASPPGGGVAGHVSTPLAGDCAPRVVTTTDAHGNSTGIAIDYVDAVQYGGRQYVAAGEDSLPAGDVGDVLGRVRCTLSSPQYADPAYRMQDGDATFVPVGAPIYAVRGVATDTEVAAARDDGVVRVYRVFQPDAAAAPAAAATP